MKQKLLPLPALALLLGYSTGVSAQDYFQKIYYTAVREEAGGLAVASGGNILMAGGTGADGAAGLERMWAQSMNEQGEVLWTFEYGNGLIEAATDIERATSGGGYWITFNSGSAPEARAGWLRISETGILMFSRKTTFDCTLDRITPLSDGGYLLTGYDYPDSWANAFALKIDANGNVVWRTGFGSAGDDVITNCWEDTQGFIYCAGYTHDSGLTKGDAMLAKLSPFGAVLWTRKYDSAGTDDTFTGIAGFDDGSLLLAGTATGFGGGYKEVWLVKTDPEGVLKWSRTYRLPDIELGAIDLLGLAGDQFVLSAADPDYQVGSPAILFKTSADGDLLWEYRYRTGGEREILREVLPAGTGFVAAGRATFNGNTGCYLVKIAGDGLIPGSDCCPEQAGLLVRDVFPQADVFTAGTIAGPGVNDYPATYLVRKVEERDVCTFIDLAFAVSDSSICPGECVDLSVLGSTPGVNYYFSTNGGVFDPSDSTRICFPADGNFFITRTGENNVCSKNRSIRVEVGTKGDAFPNAFTPNDDGVNDTFRPVFYCPVSALTFRIFNRWGQKVFETTDPNDAWDGKAGGVEAPSDVYAWQLEYEALREGKMQKLKQKGDVALLR